MLVKIILYIYKLLYYVLMLMDFLRVIIISPMYINEFIPPKYILSASGIWSG